MDELNIIKNAHFSPLLFILNTLLPVTLNSIVVHNTRKKISTEDLLTSVFVLTLGQILIVLWLVGWVFSSLSPIHITIANTIFSLFIYFFLKPREIFKTIKTILNDVFNFKKRNFSTYLKLFLLVILIQFVWLLFIGYLLPPYSHDGVMYHVPIASYFIQYQKFCGYIPTNVRWINFYPKNLELIFLWEMIFLRNDVLVNCTQVIFLFFACIGLVSLNRKIGISKEISIFCGFTFALFPLVIQQSTLAMSDIAITSLFFISISLFLEYANNKIPSSAYIGGCSAGIMLGIKGYGILFFISLCFFFILISYKAKERLSRKVALITLLLGLSLGGFWYLQNWIFYGNPIYPIPVKYGQFTIFEGKGIISVYDIPSWGMPEIFNGLSRWERVFESWRESNFVKYAYYYKGGGFGPLFFIFFIPNLIYASYISFAKKNKTFFILLIPFVINFLVFRINWYSRYNLQVLGLFALSSGITLSNIYISKFIIFFMSLVMLFNIAMGNIREQIPLTKIARFLRMPSKERIPINFYSDQNYGQLSLFKWVAKNVKKSEGVGYSFQNHLPPYFLWNRNYSSRVHCINFKDESGWRHSLKENNVKYYIVKKGEIEEKWELGTVVFENPEYKVLRSRGGVL